MFSLFAKKKKNKLKNNTPQSSAEKQISMRDGTVVYAMPEKFLVVEEKKHFWTAPKIWSVVIVVIGLLVGSVYWLLAGTVSPESVAGPEAVSEVVSSESSEPVLPSAPIVIDEPAESESAEPSPVEPIVSTEPSPVEPILPTILSSSDDTDTDGLTNIEEILYNTDPARPDSDSDGYPDLAELKNGYSPIGLEKLDETDLFITREDSSLELSVSYPADWSVRSLGADGLQIVASPDEFIIILSQPNREAESITAWYQSVAPSVVPGLIKTEMVGEHEGIFTPDRQSFYFIFPSQPKKVFIVSYNSGTLTELNFRATFELIIQNLELLAIE